MRKVIIGAFVSLDGVMQAPGGPHEDPTMGFNQGGWVAPLVNDVFGEESGKMFSEPFDLLLGRKTYEIFAAHWPYAEGGPDDFIAKTFNSITKYGRDGAVKRGDFAMNPPTPAEVARRERMKREGPV
jgi:dihydrofolate reductase